MGMFAGGTDEPWDGKLSDNRSSIIEHNKVTFINSMGRTTVPSTTTRTDLLVWLHGRNRIKEKLKIRFFYKF
jgi:hypothetical protein